MSRDFNRRELLLTAAGAWLGSGALSQALGASSRAPRKKILYFTKSAGFQHSVVARQGKALAHSERILSEIGKDRGFDVVASKDGRLFEPDRIGEWDGFVFCTTGDLTTPGTDGSPPLSAAGEKAFYDAVKNGKGFVGMHCATDTFGHHGARNQGAEDPYIQMIGGEFVIHGDQQAATLEVVDPRFPGLADGFGKSSSFKLKDEWYSLKNFAEDMHVVLLQKTEGMQGKDYQRPDYPSTWARKHGDGRVFYTNMGHREDVWTNPDYQALLLGALAWSTGQVDADLTPNLKQVAPGYAKLPA